jgi:hypothetical protein
MRSLIKNNDPGIEYIDEAKLERLRRRRRVVRLSIALCCIGLAGYFVVQLLWSSTSDPASGPAVTWSEPKSIVTWVRWNVNAICVRVRGAVGTTFTSGGNVATILKMCLCFALGALFLRAPQRY